MKEIDVTKKQLTVNLESNEEAHITNVTTLQNCSNSYILFSYEPFGIENEGAILPLKEPLFLPVNVTEIYIKASSQPSRVELFGVSL